MKKAEKLVNLVACGQASIEQMDELGPEIVANIKSNPQTLQVRSRGSDIITKNDEKRQISYLVSDETPDRVGDIIKVSGWDLSLYRKNPVILWAHDGTSVPPIGRSTNVRRRYEGSPRLTADVEFAPKEAYEFADTIYQLASRGFIKATSVGFMPLETMDLDKKAREDMGLGRYGQVFTKSELMEISIVSVPANPSALELGVKQLIKEGKFDKSIAHRFFDAYPKDEETLRKKIRSACRSFVDMGAAWDLHAKTSLMEEGAAEKAAPDELKVGDFVRWGSSGGPAEGKIEQIERDGQINVPDSSFTITGTEDDPAALIRVYRDGEATDRMVGHKFSTLTKIDQPSTASAPEGDQVSTKSPACRQAGESKEDCVSRKTAELIDEGYKQDQAVATAYSMCEKSCEEKDAPSVVLKNVEQLTEALDMMMAAAQLVKASIVEYSEYTPEDEEPMQMSAPRQSEKAEEALAVASLIEQQAEQTRATRQLVDSLTDLTKSIHRDLNDGNRSGGLVSEPDAALPDVVEDEGEDIEGLIEGRIRGFAEGLRRDLTKN